MEDQQRREEEHRVDDQRPEEQRLAELRLEEEHRHHSTNAGHEQPGPQLGKAPSAGHEDTRATQQRPDIDKDKFERRQGEVEDDL